MQLCQKTYCRISTIAATSKAPTPKEVVACFFDLEVPKLAIAPHTQRQLHRSPGGGYF
ncbi:MAG: hypothetical protein KME52_22250 [Desmonostoc geniculatum HA4340-LM1]|nr:hypothetical protein [Desmonostoc geniculatum HA4340-LM1]